MLKWIGRILYIIFVTLIVFTIEIGSGGIPGLQRGDYAAEHIIPAKDSNGNYDPLLALAHYTAAMGIYYSNNSIATFSSIGENNVEEKYQVSFEIYPLVTLISDEKKTIWNDGIIIVLKDFNDKAVSYRVEARATNTLNSSKVISSIIKDQDGNEYPNTIMVNPDDFFQNSRPALTTYIPNSYFYTNETEEDKKTLTKFEYDYVSISIYATFAKDDGETEEVFVYRVTDGSQSFGGNPKFEDSAILDLNADDFNFSKFITGKTPTDAEAATYGLVMTYHPVDLSAYNYWYWIIYTGYFILIIVIPYFWFFHRKVMAKIRQKQILKEKEEFVNQRKNNSDEPPLEPIFKDEDETEQGDEQ